MAVRLGWLHMSSRKVPIFLDRPKKELVFPLHSSERATSLGSPSEYQPPSDHPLVEGVDCTAQVEAYGSQAQVATYDLHEGADLP